MALSTPLTCSNTPWTPQKQPPARTTVSRPLPAGSSTAGAGIFTAPSATPRPAVPKTANAPRSATAAAPASRRDVEVFGRRFIGSILSIDSGWEGSDGGPGDEAHGHAVHAVAQARRLRPVVEEVAEVGVAKRARDFR